MARSSDRLSDDEVERWAVIFADEMSDPNSPARAQLLAGLSRPKTMRAVSVEMKFPGLAGKFRPSLIEPFRNAILSADRGKLLQIGRKMFKEIPRSHVEFVRRHLVPRDQRKFLLALADTLKGKPGRPSKSKVGQYGELVARADLIYPALLQVLRELERGTRHSVAEILDFLAVDYQDAVAYLKLHTVELEKSLTDARRLKGAKRIETQARRLAAGLSGLGEGYSFSTSVERVRQGSRIAKSSTANSPQKD